MTEHAKIPKYPYIYIYMNKFRVRIKLKDHNSGWKLGN